MNLVLFKIVLVCDNVIAYATAKILTHNDFIVKLDEIIVHNN